MSVLGLVNGTIDQYSKKLPVWAYATVTLWLLFAGLVYFGIIELSEIGWWRPVVMAPMVVLVLAAFLHMAVLFVSWLTAPARWLLKRWKAE